MKLKKLGKYIVRAGANPWPHEIETAKSLIQYGHIVEFIPEDSRKHSNNADVYIDGEKWEMKAPKASTTKGVEQNLRRASRQADSVVFDSRRMRRVPDKAIKREISAKLPFVTKIKRLKFVDRGGKIVDI